MTTDADPRCDFCERRFIRIVRGVAVCEKHLRNAPGGYPSEDEWPTHCGETAFWNGRRFLCGRCHHEWTPVPEGEQVARSIYREFNDAP